jgi:glyceraldehyde 3-phosphate dehydrogenase
LKLKTKTSLSSINTILKKYTLKGDLVKQIKYSLSKEMVSSDGVETSDPSIYDSKVNIVADNGENIVLYIWYDNDYGYSHRVIRLAKCIAKARRVTYY